MTIDNKVENIISWTEDYEEISEEISPLSDDKKVQQTNYNRLTLEIFPPMKSDLLNDDGIVEGTEGVATIKQLPTPNITVGEGVILPEKYRHEKQLLDKTAMKRLADVEGNIFSSDGILVAKLKDRYGIKWREKTDDDNSDSGLGLGGSFGDYGDIKDVIPPEFSFAYIYYFGRVLVSDNGDSIINYDTRLNGERMKGKTISYYNEVYDAMITELTAQTYIGSNKMPTNSKRKVTYSRVTIVYINDPSWFEVPVIHEDIKLAPSQYSHRYAKELRNIRIFSDTEELGSLTKKGHESEFADMNFIV